MSERTAASAPTMQAGRISAWTVAALLAVAIIPLAVILYSLNDAESAHKAWREACLAPEKEKTEVSGVVRLRDGGFYLDTAATAHYLGKACDGKHAAACLDSNPGKLLLAHQQGQAATASLCDGEVLSYRLAGRAFYK